MKGMPKIETGCAENEQQTGDSKQDSSHNPNSLFLGVYHAGNYLAVSAYYKQRGYAINNKFKSNLIQITETKIDACWENIGELLSVILDGCGAEFFLKPMKNEKNSPKNLLQLINIVNRDGYYLLLSQASLTIFLRSQNDTNDNLRNGKDALRNLCQDLLDLFASEIMSSDHQFFLSNVENFSVKQLSKHSYLNFSGITQSLIKNNVTILLNHLDKLPRGEEQVSHEDLVSLIRFKDLFLLKILEILNYGNLNRRNDFDETLRSSDFYQDDDCCDGDSHHDLLKMKIMRQIYQITGHQSNQRNHWEEIVNFLNPADLITSLGFNNSLNPYDWQLENSTDLCVCDPLFGNNLPVMVTGIQEIKPRTPLSGSEWEEENSVIDHEEVQELEKFFKVVCESSRFLFPRLLPGLDD
jgi:hypothetical protein